MAQSLVVFENTGEVELTNVGCTITVTGSLSESTIFSVNDLGGNGVCNISEIFNDSVIDIPSILPGTSIILESLDIMEGSSDIVVTATTPTHDQVLNGPYNNVLSASYTPTGGKPVVV